MTRILLLTALLGTACHGSGRTPLEVANERVANSAERGYLASNEQGQVTLDVRYNPAACDCPDFEILAFGGWVRAFVEAPPGADASLRALEQGDSLAVAKINGRVEPEPRTAENGVQYLVVTVL